MAEIDEAVRRAAAAAATRVGRGRTDKDVSALVERFAMHPDGYLHARVLVGGQRFYFHRKHGSWLAPGQVGTRTMLKEPEGLLGSQLGSEIKHKLSELSAPYDLARRREREAREEAKRRAQQPATKPDGPAGDSETGGPDRVQDQGHSGRTPEPVSPDGS